MDLSENDRRKDISRPNEQDAHEDNRRELRRREDRERWSLFGTWVRERRIEVGRTQAECAAVAGIQPVQWSRIEIGSYGTPVKRVRSIAYAINVDPSLAYIQAGYSRHVDIEKAASPPDYPIITLEDLSRIEKRLDTIEKQLALLMKKIE